MQAALVYMTTEDGHISPTIYLSDISVNLNVVYGDTNRFRVELYAEGDSCAFYRPFLTFFKYGSGLAVLFYGVRVLKVFVCGVDPIAKKWCDYVVFANTCQR